MGPAGKVRRRQEEDGEGAQVIRVILATVTEVAAGAEAGMEEAGDDRIVAMLRVTSNSTTAIKKKTGVY